MLMTEPLNVEAVPPALKEHPRWVCWKYVEREGKPTKCPVDPKTGGLADSTDLATWATFDVALAACQTGSLAGVGFVFAPDGGFCGVDLDEAGVLTIRDRAIDIVHHNRETLNRDRLLTGFPNVQADMRNLRIAISTPGYGRSALPLLHLHQGILNCRAGRGLRSVGEFQLQADVTSGVNVCICAA